MQKIKLLAATLLVIAPFAANATFIGPIYTYGGSEYQLIGNTSWLDAEAQSVAWGGHLVAVNDMAEQSFLTSIWTQLVWIGLNDVAVEGTFEWSNGDAFAFSNWAAGEPNNQGGNEDFVEMNRFGLGLWNDLPSGHPRQGIAERAAAVPEPGPLALLGLGLAGIGLARRRRKV